MLAFENSLNFIVPLLLNIHKKVVILEQNKGTYIWNHHTIR